MHNTAVSRTSLEVASEFKAYHEMETRPALLQAAAQHTSTIEEVAVKTRGKILVYQLKLIPHHRLMQQ